MPTSAANEDDGSVVPRWPRFRLWRRFYYSADDALGRFPMIVLGAIIGALIGTAVASERPASIIMRHHQWFVALHAQHVLLGTILGGVSGVAAVWAGALLWAAGHYRFKGDVVWEACFGGRLREIGLRCKEGAIPESIEALGAIAAVECRLKAPSGTVVSSRRQGDVLPLGLHKLAWLPALEKVEAGTYKVWWYAPRGKGKLCEIARAKVTIPHVSADLTPDGGAS